MNPVSRALDKLGLLLLAASGIALGGSFWFTGDVVSDLLLRGFFPCIGAAVMTFLSARVIELALFAVSDPGQAYRRAEAQPLATRTSATILAATWPKRSAAAADSSAPVLDDAA